MYLELSVVLLLAVQAMSQDQVLDSTLHSTVDGIPVAYVGETVVFTCVVRGSNSMAWTSDEYIGTGVQRLELSAGDPVGTNYTAVANIRTIATLVNATINEFIISRLQITIKPDYQIASVRCLNINTDTATSATFFRADTTSVTCDRQSVCSGDTVTVTCTTANSNTLVWMINGSTLNFTSTDPLLTRRNVAGSSTSAVLINSSDTNGIRVITSSLTFLASMTNILTCENTDRSTTTSVIIPISETCPDPSQVTSPARNDGSTSSTCPGLIAATVIFLIIACGAVLALIVIVIGCLRKIKDVKNERDKGAKEIIQLTADKTKLTTELQTEQNKTASLTKDNNDLTTVLKANENTIKQLDKDMNEARDMLNKQTFENSLLQAKAEKQESSKTKAEEKIKLMKTTVDELQRQLQTAQRKVKSFEAEMAEQKDLLEAAKLKTVSFKDEMNGLNQQLESAKKTTMNVEGQLGGAQTKDTQKSSLTSSLEDPLGDAQTKTESLKNNMEKLNKLLIDAHTKTTSLEKNVKGLNEALVSAHTKTNTLKDTVDQLKSQLKAKK